MSQGFTRVNLSEVEDSAPGLGLGEHQESRFATEAVGSRSIGVTHHRFAAGARQPFAHMHEKPEEVYVVLSGSGRLKLDDEILELRRLDAVRVEPQLLRAFEAGPDGLEVLAFGPHYEGDGELVPGWWSG